MFSVIQAQTKEELYKFLEENGVSPKLFKKDLYKEIENKDCIVGKNLITEKIERRVQPVFINVFYNNLKLFEEKICLYEGGKEVKQLPCRDLPGSIGEKSLLNETPQTAAARGLKEELGLDIDASRLLSEGEPKREERPSSNYPNLTSIYITSIFTLSLYAEEYKPEGYIEDQCKDGLQGKKTFFTWR